MPSLYTPLLTRVAPNNFVKTSYSGGLPQLKTWTISPDFDEDFNTLANSLRGTGNYSFYYSGTYWPPTNVNVYTADRTNPNDIPLRVGFMGRDLYRLNPATVSVHSVDPDGNVIYPYAKKFNTLGSDSFTITPNDLYEVWNYNKPTEDIVVDLSQSAEIDVYAVYTPIRRIEITVNYVDDAGNELLPPTTIYVTDTVYPHLYTVSNFAYIFGYNEPADIVVDLSTGNDVTVNAVYTPYTAEQWQAIKNSTSLIHFKQEQNARRYYIGSNMPSYIV